MDGFTLSRRRITQGVTTTAFRSYTAQGMAQTRTDGRGNTTANALNQYTAIQENAEASFSPLFDADGNQTRIKTETGIWEVIYNAENRPVSFTNAESNTVVECAYDSMGRRAYKKVTSNGTVTLHQRYIYRGYLQIAALDLTHSNHPSLWFITWDPTQPIATRPLSIRINGTWFTYGWDLTKNICELYSTGGSIATSYTYTPFGEVTSSGNIGQPIQWSSEYHDTELDLVYYNYRYYHKVEGRWLGRDPINEFLVMNLYLFCNNQALKNNDLYGMLSLSKDCCKYIVITGFHESEIDEDEIESMFEELEERTEKHLRERMLNIIKLAKIKVLNSMEILHKVISHGHSYWYLYYAYKCNNCKKNWEFGVMNISGEGANLGRNLYYFEHAQKKRRRIWKRTAQFIGGRYKKAKQVLSQQISDTCCCKK